MRHELVGGVELDDHFAIGGGVEPVDGVLHHMLGQGRAGIGLQPPADRRLRLDIGRGQGRGAHGASGGQARPLQKATLVE
ncbi:hypothetical protein D3C72_1949300 [compost metagenome]